MRLGTCGLHWLTRLTWNISKKKKVMSIKAETQPATRSKEREGDGRKGDKRRRRAWPHRTKHQEPDAARGAASEIPRKTGATGAPKGHAYNPAHAGANRGAVRGCFRTRHLHRDGRERQPSGRKISHVISSGTLAKQQVIEWTGDSLPVADVEETDACMALILNSSQRSLLQAATQFVTPYLT